MTDLFAPGDDVMICGEARRTVARVLWVVPSICPVDGLPIYRVDVGGGHEWEICESVLARRNEQ